MKTSLKADAQAIGRWVARVVKSPEAHELLGPMIPDRRNSWTRGGCCVLAMALHEYLGRGNLMMVSRRGGVVHIMLELGGVFIDADGPHTKGEVETTWGNPMGSPAAVAPFDAGLANQSGVRCPDPEPFVWYLERVQPRIRFSGLGSSGYDVPMARSRSRGRMGAFNPTMRVAFGRRSDWDPPMSFATH